MPSLTWHKTLRDMEINLEHMLHCSVLFSIPLKFNIIYNSRWSRSDASDFNWTKRAETYVRGEHCFRTHDSCFPLTGQWDQRWWPASVLLQHPGQMLASITLTGEASLPHCPTWTLPEVAMRHHPPLLFMFCIAFSSLPGTRWNSQHPSSKIPSQVGFYFQSCLL